MEGYGESEEDLANQIENAVLTVQNPTTSNIDRQNAQSFMNSVRDSENGWQICINLFQNSSQSEVRFYCLHVFQHAIENRCISLFLLFCFLFVFVCFCLFVNTLLKNHKKTKKMERK